MHEQSEVKRVLEVWLARRVEREAPCVLTLCGGDASLAALVQARIDLLDAIGAAIEVDGDEPGACSGR